MVNDTIDLTKENAVNEEQMTTARVKVSLDLWSRTRSYCILRNKQLPEICTNALEGYLLIHEHKDFQKFLCSAKKMNTCLWDYMVSLLEKEEKK